MPTLINPQHVSAKVETAAPAILDFHKVEMPGGAKWQIDPREAFPDLFIKEYIFTEVHSPVPVERSLVKVQHEFLPSVPLTPRTPALPFKELPAPSVEQALPELPKQPVIIHVVSQIPAKARAGLNIAGLSSAAADFVSKIPQMIQQGVSIGEINTQLARSKKQLQDVTLQRVSAHAEDLGKIIGLRTDEFQQGNSVEISAISKPGKTATVIAHQIKTRPIKFETRPPMALDPILWQVTGMGKEFDGVNAAAALSCKLMTLAETFDLIRVTVSHDRYFSLARSMFPDIAKRMTNDELLARISMYQDPFKAQMGMLALKAQILAARMGLQQGLIEHFSSGSLVLIADAAVNFTTGDLKGISDAKVRKAAENGLTFIQGGGAHEEMIRSLTREVEEMKKGMERSAKALGLREVLDRHLSI